MERLTEWVGDGADRKAIARQDRREIGDKDCVARLAAYEDTGLEAKEFDQLCREMSTIRVALGFKTLEELRCVIADERLVVLPCNVGDRLWYIHNGGIYQATVHEISISPSGETALVFGGWPAQAVWGCNIGKTVFLTLEAAKEALKKEEARQ